MDVSVLVKSHSGKQPLTTVLDHVDVSVHPGQAVALMGPSGAGKTSLMNVMSGTVSPSQGHVNINGTQLVCGRGDDPADAVTHAAFRKLCAFIPQDDTLVESLTACEALDFTAQLRMPRGTTRKQLIASLVVISNIVDCTPRTFFYDRRAWSNRALILLARIQ